MGKRLNLIGQKFNRLTVIKDCGGGGRFVNVKWECLCDCGNKVNVQGSYLKNGNTKSCGCYKRDRIRESNVGGGNRLRLDGQKFGRLTVLNDTGIRVKRSIMWECKCDCGNVVVVRGSALKTGGTKSCGCYRNERVKISISKRANYLYNKYDKEYKTWLRMKSRCYDEKTKNYRLWGGRGIKVCDRWLGEDGFKNFILDLGEKPVGKYSLDRFPDKNGNYEPNNCRWATQREQSRNRCSNVMIEYNGERKIMSDWIRTLKNFQVSE